MNLESFHSLFTSSGEGALEAAVARQPREADFLNHLQALSRHFPYELAKAALVTAVLRREAAAKFPLAGQMYLTREAFEQASSYEVSTYRAGRYQGFPWRIDLGCSIGGDSLGLASQGRVAGIDLDLLRLAMARENLKAYGFAERASLMQADLTSPLPIRSTAGGAAAHTAIFFDPARRSGGRRAFSVQAYTPPLSILKSWLPVYPALGVKISPGVDLAELSEYEAEVEFISLRGELKEAVLWFGPLKTARRRATLLPGPYSLTTELDHPLAVHEPRLFIYEPDPAVLRAGLVAELGSQLGADQMDADIAYLTADQSISTPFARLWKVLDWFPFSLKRLRTYLRGKGIGHLVVKKRGSPLEPEALIQSLRLTGEKEALIFLTHLRGRPIVLLAEESGPAQPGTRDRGEG